MSLARTAPLQPFPADSFADVIAANEEYARAYTASDLSGWAAKGSPSSPAWTRASIR